MPLEGRKPSDYDIKETYEILVNKANEILLSPTESEIKFELHKHGVHSDQEKYDYLYTGSLMDKRQRKSALQDRPGKIVRRVKRAYSVFGKDVSDEEHEETERRSSIISEETDRRSQAISHDTFQKSDKSALRKKSSKTKRRSKDRKKQSVASHRKSIIYKRLQDVTLEDELGDHLFQIDPLLKTHKRNNDNVVSAVIGFLQLHLEDEDKELIREVGETLCDAYLTNAEVVYWIKNVALARIYPSQPLTVDTLTEFILETIDPIVKEGSTDSGGRTVSTGLSSYSTVSDLSGSVYSLKSFKQMGLQDQQSTVKSLPRSVSEVSDGSSISEAEEMTIGSVSEAAISEEEVDVPTLEHTDIRKRNDSITIETVLRFLEFHDFERLELVSDLLKSDIVSNDEVIDVLRCEIFDEVVVPEDVADAVCDFILGTIDPTIVATSDESTTSESSKTSQATLDEDVKSRGSSTASVASTRKSSAEQRSSAVSFTKEVVSGVFEVSEEPAVVEGGVEIHIIEASSLGSDEQDWTKAQVEGSPGGSRKSSLVKGDEETTFTGDDQYSTLAVESEGGLKKDSASFDEASLKSYGRDFALDEESVREARKTSLLPKSESRRSSKSSKVSFAVSRSPALSLAESRKSDVSKEGIDEEKSKEELEPEESVELEVESEKPEESGNEEEKITHPEAEARESMKKEDQTELEKPSFDERKLSEATKKPDETRRVSVRPSSDQDKGMVPTKKPSEAPTPPVSPTEKPSFDERKLSQASKKSFDGRKLSQASKKPFDGRKLSQASKKPDETRKVSEEDKVIPPRKKPAESQDLSETDRASTVSGVSFDPSSYTYSTRVGSISAGSEPVVYKLKRYKTKGKTINIEESNLETLSGNAPKTPRFSRHLTADETFIIACKSDSKSSISTALLSDRTVKIINSWMSLLGLVELEAVAVSENVANLERKLYRRMKQSRRSSESRQSRRDSMRKSIGLSQMLAQESPHEEPVVKQHHVTHKKKKKRFDGWDSPGFLETCKMDHVPTEVEQTQTILKALTDRSRPKGDGDAQFAGDLIHKDSAGEAKEYVIKQSINELFQFMLSNLIVDKPNNPIDYLIDLTRAINKCMKIEKSAGINCPPEEQKDFSQRYEVPERQARDDSVEKNASDGNARKKSQR